MAGHFHWPEPIGPVPVSCFLEPPEPGLRTKNVPLGPMPTGQLAQDNVQLAIWRWATMKKKNAFTEADLFGDVSCSIKFCSWMDGRVPCMLHSHPKGAWSIKRGRHLTISERARCFLNLKTFVF